MRTVDRIQIACRIMVGLFFVTGGIVHFWQKAAVIGYGDQAWIPWPDVMVPVTGVLLIVFGAMLVLGLWADFAAINLAIFSFVAAILVHHWWEFSGYPAANELVNFMRNGLFIAALAMVTIYYAQTGKRGLALTDPLIFKRRAPHLVEVKNIERKAA